MISIVGYGSLLSERSARETIPGLENFRIVTVPGYRRIFNKVGVVFLSRYGADPHSLELASCSTEACNRSQIICSQFECSEADFAELYEREHRFNWVDVETLSASGERSIGRMCSSSTDNYYRNTKCRSEAEYQQRVGQYYAGLLWRTDILPYPRYLAFCLQAAHGLGGEALDNFLDHSYLADGKTPIRDYVETHESLSSWRSIDCGYSYETETNS
ncbi:gamma-glutamylcyclotransferase [Neptuniibacter sp.]|uniref:gamma-glutamylcyclotransferase n=1 Tax=Neptuniibacter sp. TaxID=1962643 RepID=UPI00262F9E4B|nr:gamma-glutamylcyclotransferase [Neptuniibacter sp.]MCP4595603.1 gamma-glutamylcyclotransferase [Neptuniibacter sp.]